MKSLLLLLTTFIFISCQKENSKTMTETLATQPLKAVANYTVNGLKITFDVSKSTGILISYGYQLEDSSPTFGPVTYSPNSSHKGADFVPITAIVTKTGTYTFRLTVYDKSNEDHTIFNVEVK